MRKSWTLPGQRLDLLGQRCSVSIPLSTSRTGCWESLCRKAYLHPFPPAGTPWWRHALRKQRCSLRANDALKLNSQGGEDLQEDGGKLRSSGWGREVVRCCRETKDQEEEGV